MKKKNRKKIKIEIEIKKEKTRNKNGKRNKEKETQKIEKEKKVKKGKKPGSPPTRAASATSLKRHITFPSNFTSLCVLSEAISVSSCRTFFLGNRSP
jgi:hypothetical protein